MITRMPWNSHLLWQYNDWMIENVGPRVRSSEPTHGIYGRGWNIVAATYEDPRAQVELFDDHFLVEIEDERLMTAFLLRWGQ